MRDHPVIWPSPIYVCQKFHNYYKDSSFDKMSTVEIYVWIRITTPRCWRALSAEQAELQHSSSDKIILISAVANNTEDLLVGRFRIFIFIYLFDFDPKLHPCPSHVMQPCRRFGYAQTGAAPGNPVIARVPHSSASSSQIACCEPTLWPLWDSGIRLLLP